MRPKDVADIRAAFQRADDDQGFATQKCKTNEDLRDQLCKVIVRGQHAFHIVKELEFRRFVQGAYPDLSMPREKTVKKHILQSFDTKQVELRTTLQGHEGKIGTSMDLWTDAHVVVQLGSNTRPTAGLCNPA
jgi:hypothetical protein